jgi:hypothetical protein
MKTLIFSVCFMLFVSGNLPGYTNIILGIGFALCIVFDFTDYFKNKTKGSDGKN